METSNDDQARIAALEQQMQDMNGRLAGLERAASLLPVPGRPGDAPEPAGEQGEEATVGYSGRGRFGPRRLAIRQRMTLSEVLSVTPESIAPVFAGLGSPARIGLLYALIEGPRTSQQLREVLDAPSAGQLYHHLRELLGAGLIAQPARSVYQIPPGKIVAVCAAVTAAAQLASVSHQAPPPIVPEPEEEEPPGGDG